MKSLRIICGALGGLHYSSTPDLALDTCPVCGEACREIEVEVKKTLLDLLYEADVIEIEGVFCRNFHMDYDLDEDDENTTIMDLEFEADGNYYELYFTKEDLTTAFKYPEREGWGVAYRMETISIVPYKVNEIKA